MKNVPKGSTIIITGAAGFIGSHLAKRLVEEKYRVIGIDNLITGSKKNIKTLKKLNNFEFFKHDITKPFPKLMKKKFNKLSYILDLACPASPVDFPKFPIEIMEVCSKGVQNLLELAKEYKVPFLQTSTSEVYGDPEIHPQPESYWGHANSYGPRSCYDEGKRYAEALIYSYHNKFNIKTQIIRIFNTYGPQMRPDDGRVVSNLIVQALSGKNLTVYGQGTQTRSFCYISDMIEGIIAMIESGEEGPINIGNPGEFTILELAKKVIKLTNTKSKIIFKSLPKDDPKQRKPIITLAQKKLGWKPKIKLDDGLKMTIDFFKNN